MRFREGLAIEYTRSYKALGRHGFRGRMHVGGEEQRAHAILAMTSAPVGVRSRTERRLNRGAQPVSY